MSISPVFWVYTKMPTMKVSIPVPEVLPISSSFTVEVTGDVSNRGSIFASGADYI
jgi:hypothetical protein